MPQEFRRCRVVDAPKAGDNSFCPGVHEPTRQTYKSFTTYILAERSFAPAKNNQVRVQLQSVNILKSQITVLGLSRRGEL